MNELTKLDKEDFCLKCSKALTCHAVEAKLVEVYEHGHATSFTVACDSAELIVVDEESKKGKE